MPIKEEEIVANFETQSTPLAPDLNTPVTPEPPEQRCGYEDFWDESKQGYYMGGSLDITDQVNGDKEWSNWQLEMLRNVIPEECWSILNISQPAQTGIDPTSDESQITQHDIVIDTGKNYSRSMDLKLLPQFLDLMGMQLNSNGSLGDVMSYLGGYLSHGGS